MHRPTLIETVTRYYCPNCDWTHATKRFDVPQGKREYYQHPCVGLGGLMAPLILEGVKCKVEAQVREDYVGREITHNDENGRPITAVITTRDEGQDARGNVPCVQVSASKDLDLDFNVLVANLFGGKR